MKKLTTLLALLLCVALLFPCAIAEESAAYVPGEITRSALVDAWQNGQMLNADLKVRLNADPSVFGFAADEAHIFNSICTALDNATLKLAAGYTGNKLRLEAGATLKHAQGGNDVTVNAAANADLYGISLESDLLSGRKVTAKWETLLAMAGMSDSDINMLISMRALDWKTILPQVLTMVESYLTMAAQMVEPYIATCESWFATLTTEVLENVPAADGLPAAAQVVNIYLCEKDVGNLLSAIADTLEKDATLKVLIDTLLAQAIEEMGETAPTAAQIVSELRSAAAQMTDTESPIMLTLAVDESGMPLYSELYVIGSNDAGVYGSIVAVPTETGADFSTNFMAIQPDGSVSDGFSMEIDASAEALNVLAQVFAYGSPVFGYSQNITYASVTTADGQPGFSSEQSVTMNIVDGSDEVQALMTGNTIFARTADGGETSDATVNMDMYADGQAISVTALSSTALLKNTDGSFTYIAGMTESMPAMGIEAIGFDVTVTPSTYDPATTAALSEIALETASGDTMDALGEALTSAAQLKAMEAVQALPTELLTLIMNNL